MIVRPHIFKSRTARVAVHVLNIYKVFTLFVTEKDRCHPNPCLHDGMCMEINDELGFLCNCTAGYRGTHCQGTSNIEYFFEVILDLGNC